MGGAECIEVGAGDDGTTVQVHRGEAICVDLPETPTTGYRWTPAAVDAEVMALDGDDFVSAGPEPGAGGTRRLRFRAVHAGSTSIELISRRAWETVPAGGDRFRITVRVLER